MPVTDWLFHFAFVVRDIRIAVVCLLFIGILQRAKAQELNTKPSFHYLTPEGEVY
jgi:hypothetical protein